MCERETELCTRHSRDRVVTVTLCKQNCLCKSKIYFRKNPINIYLYIIINYYSLGERDKTNVRCDST